MEDPWKVGGRCRAAGENITARYIRPDPGLKIFSIEIQNPGGPDEPGWLRYGLKGLREGLVLVRAAFSGRGERPGRSPAGLLQLGWQLPRRP